MIKVMSEKDYGTIGDNLKKVVKNPKVVTVIVVIVVMGIAGGYILSKSKPIQKSNNRGEVKISAPKSNESAKAKNQETEQPESAVTNESMMTTDEKAPEGLKEDTALIKNATDKSIANFFQNLYSVGSLSSPDKVKVARENMEKVVSNPDIVAEATKGMGDMYRDATGTNEGTGDIPYSQTGGITVALSSKTDTEATFTVVVPFSANGSESEGLFNVTTNGDGTKISKLEYKGTEK